LAGALVAMLAAPSLALAAAMSAGGAIDVQVWPQGGETVVITSVEVPATTKLPVTVRIPVVPGSKIEWVGEIVGTNVASDIERKYKLVDGEGGQYAEFILSTSRHGQIDSVASSLTVSGTTISTAIDWVQSVSSEDTLFSVRLPSGMSEVKIKPEPEGKPADNGSGETLYTMPTKTLAPGSKTAVTVSYSTVPAPVKDAKASSANTILLVLGGVLALAVGALVVAMRRRSS
jgi:hypothetical protein